MGNKLGSAHWDAMKATSQQSEVQVTILIFVWFLRTLASPSEAWTVRGVFRVLCWRRSPPAGPFSETLLFPAAVAARSDDSIGLDIKGSGYFPLTPARDDTLQTFVMWNLHSLLSGTHVKSLSASPAAVRQVWPALVTANNDQSGHCIIFRNTR